MNLYCMILIIFKVCNDVQAVDHQTVTIAKFYLNIRAPAITVREGTKVTLTCQKSSGHVLYINFVYALGELFITLIDTSNMTNISNKYTFHETNENTYSFTIISISREDDGSYTCVQGPVSRSRAISVIYGPSGSSPQCSSNYKSPIIFYDEITDDFVFYCSTERGKPPVTTKIYVNEEDVTSDLEIINETRTDKENMLTTYSLFRHFNHTLQNSEFVCNVTQQLPSPYDDYQGSCSFGPLHLLPGFSLSVSPSNVTVREESNITVTCTCNVTGVKIEWNNIPSEKYIVTNYNRSSVLTILSFKPASDGTIFVECSGSYGSRTITANTTVFVMADAEGHEDDDNYKKSVTFLPLLVACIVFSIILVTVLVALFICQNKRKSKRNPTNTPPGNNGLEKPSTSNHCEGHTVTTTEELNMNNANNTAICGEDSVKCDNACYESTSCGNFINSAKTRNAKVVDNGNPSYEVGNYVLDDDHIMCENVIYQSVSYANKKGTNTAGIAF
ncbi:hypothetical protein HOLleu_38926 [Holothuria leucospilota]|uniref:Ig-like domain-containing protein n=1 Tax=Holothuria leucospilota TaxID=206669 RepID=A0A9Q0YFD8_HOLLE|nr:hypothetical protein HOLleu_38926 [Holothuria leucospilota]